ncbi:MAG: RDD family protein [Actinomycetota bacterium]|nr:RDD family protein [Actinomycetota bacterium]
MARAEHGIVTPEAVRLDFEEAGVGSRGAALLLDYCVIGVILVGLNVGTVYLLDSGETGLPPWVTISLFLVLNVVVLFGYPIGLETLWRGRTLGKAAMGLRVVTVEGAPVRFRHAAVRAALSLVDFGLTAGAAAVVTALVSRRHQRLGDLVAGTVVLRERTGAARPQVATFAVPNGAESYAETIDPSGLSAADYDALRAYLLRAGSLPQSRRAHLASDLAGGLAVKVAHTPPPGTAPELFLACLAARYQQRGHGRAESPAATAPPEAAKTRVPTNVDDGSFSPPT